MLEFATAEAVIDGELERQLSHRSARETPVMRAIYWAFADRGGPVAVDAILAGVPGLSSEAVASRLVELDEDDVIQVTEGRVEIAYPFSTRRTPFAVRWAGGPERYACCAIDALGMAPMLGQEVSIAGRCHHCGAPLALAMTPRGPGRGMEDVVMWVSRRSSEPGQRAMTGH
jgi:hypothetical protein